ncbi:unnamed protein product [Rotaria magnacalcarata]
MNPQNTSFLNNSRDSSRRSSISVISNRFDSVITGELKSLNIEAEKLKNVTKEIIVIRRVQMKFCVFALVSALFIYTCNLCYFQNECILGHNHQFNGNIIHHQGLQSVSGFTLSFHLRCTCFIAVKCHKNQMERHHFLKEQPHF